MEINNREEPRKLASHTTSFRVRYADTDKMGVVYHGKYVEYLEVGRTEFMRALGFPYAKLEAEGIGLVIVEVRAKYRASAHYDELISVKCWAEKIKSASVTLAYQILKDDTLLIDASTTLVCVDMQTKKARKLPENLRQALLSSLSADEN